MDITREEFEKLERQVETMRRAEQGNKDRAVKRANFAIEELRGQFIEAAEQVSQTIAKLEKRIFTLEKQLEDALQEIVTYERTD